MTPKIKAFLKSVLLLKGVDGPCVNWPYASNGKYGHITFSGKDKLVHRLVCELVHGEPPTNKHQCAHSCHNKLCCRPSHLRWATQSENRQDEANTNNGSYKLTRKEITKIRSSKEIYRVLAKKYGVSISHIGNIKAKRTWRG